MVEAIELANIALGIGGFVIHGENANDISGLSVASAGDVNGDGFDDLIIGAPGADPKSNVEYGAGGGYVVFGKGSDFGTEIDLADIANGVGGFAIFGGRLSYGGGLPVAGAGDIDGNGLDDLIISAPTGASLGFGDCYVVLGRASDVGTAIDLDHIANGVGGFVLRSEYDGDNLGGSVASAGDINGDGFDDLIFGASGPNGPGEEFAAGASYVVFGRASGFGAGMRIHEIAAGIGGFVIYGEEFDDTSGTSVASAGDINGDGFGDLIIGARGADGAGNLKSYAGDSYVVFGQANGFGAAIDLATIAAGVGGFVIHGEDTMDWAGFAVSSAGDVNGDAFEDLIIGAPQADGAGNQRKSSGASYVVFGKASGWGEAIDISDIGTGIGGFVIHGEDAYDTSGFAMSSAGDINGDGFDDLIIGARGADGAANLKDSAGASYVVFGRASGFGATIDLADIAAGIGGFVIYGADAGDWLGQAVSSAGDINGDGFDDLIIGAFLADGAGDLEYNAGASYVLLGRDFTSSVTHAGTPGADTLTGTGGADVIVAGLGDDTLIGGAGGKDAFSGGAGNDIIAVTGPGFRRADGGSGIDTLRLTASGRTLDLTAIANTRIQHIEAIDLTGVGNSALRLTALEVLNLSDTSNTLRVTGNAGDTLTLLDHGWIDAGSAGGIRTLTKGQATLRVDQAVVVIKGWIILGAIGADSLVGTRHDDSILGFGDDDTLRGFIGADTLNGGVGADIMSGGLGDDIYMVDDPADVVIEAAGAGFDGVVARVAYTLAANLENLTLIGVAADGVGNARNNRLIGNALANTLLGEAGADTLEGGAGNDSMSGGLGDDVYMVDDPADVVVETAGAGLDGVVARVAYTLAANLENLTLIGVAADGVGNARNNRLIGNALANTLLGEAGADTLEGGAGNDTLYGGTGLDRLAGGAGDDLFVLDQATEAVVEGPGGGFDVVATAAAAYVLAYEVEAVFGLNAIRHDFTGNNLGNAIAGNARADLLAGLWGNDTLLGEAGADTLLGGAGDDVLTGGAGGDVFRFGTSAEGIDRIEDFTTASDRIEISTAGFGGLLPIGILGAGNFVSSAVAVGLAPQFVYVAATGSLLWDADGAGGAPSLAIAILTGAPLLAATDIALVA